MVSCGGSCRGEHGSARTMRAQISLPREHVLTRQYAEFGERRCELLMLGIHDRIRTIGRNDTASPTALADPAMAVESIDG